MLSDLSRSCDSREKRWKRGNHGGRAGPFALTTPDSTISTPSSAKRPSCGANQTTMQQTTHNNHHHHHMSSTSRFHGFTSRFPVASASDPPPACRAPAPPVAPAAARPVADSKKAAPGGPRRRIFGVSSFEFFWGVRN